MYDSETMIWRKKERSRNRTVKKDDLRGLFGIRRIDKFQNARIRIRKRLMKVDRMEKDCLKKSGLEVRQARRMVHDRSIWR